MSVAKVTLRFDVLPEEKERLERVCDAYKMTKIDFLRASLSLAENEIEETRKRIMQKWNPMDEVLPAFDKEKFMQHFKDRDIQKEGEK